MRWHVQWFDVVEADVIISWGILKSIIRNFVAVLAAMAAAAASAAGQRKGRFGGWRLDLPVQVKDLSIQEGQQQQRQLREPGRQCALDLQENVRLSTFPFWRNCCATRNSRISMIRLSTAVSKLGKLLTSLNPRL